MKYIKKVGLAIYLLIVIAAGMFPRAGNSIPAYARKYKTTCARCHMGFPKLNAFGKNFQLHGYQQPGDQTVGKISTPEDNNLSLLENLPIAIHVESRLAFDNIVNGNNSPASIDSPTSFHVLASDTLAPDIGFFGEVSTEEHMTDVMKVVLSFNHLANQNVHLQVGKIDVMEHGVTEHDLFSNAGYSTHDLSLGGFSLAEENMGIRLYGMIGSSVTPALIHGTDKGQTSQATPSAAMAHGPKADPLQEGVEELPDPMDQLKGLLWEVGVFNGTGDPATRNAKDVQARANMYFGGDSFLGVFGYQGQSTPGVGIVNKHRLAGVDFSVYFGKPFQSAKGMMQKPFNLLGGYISGKADNPLGTSTAVNWNGYFLEGDYFIGPKSIFLVRYDKLRSNNLPAIRAHTLTANYTRLLRTNFLIGLEYTRDLTNSNLDRLGINFNFSF